MGQKKYPPLGVHEVEAILGRRGFLFKRQTGDHAQFERGPIPSDPQRRVVTVDRGAGDFGDKLIKSMIAQSGMTREQFYGATKRTAQKAGVQAIKMITQELEAVPEPEGD